MSPFLMRLDQELRLTNNERERGEIQARWAGYLARTGDFDGARSKIVELRQTFGDGHSGRVTIWIMIAEALIYHFESLSSVALDRIIRAQFLSRLMQDHQLEAITSAWRAHIEFDSSKYSEMIESLQIAFKRADSGNNDALARASNIVSKTALLCGETDLARTHFMLSRDHALKEGDQASVEALQHNKAAFRLARLRASMCLGGIDPVEIKETRVEIATAKSLQNLAGIKALSSYIELCQARLLIVEKRFQEAFDALQIVRGSGPFPLSSFTPELIELEIVFCLSELGRIDEAFHMFNENLYSALNNIDSDERLAVQWMRLQLSKIDSRFGSVVSAEALFKAAAANYHELMNELRQGLNVISIVG